MVMNKEQDCQNISGCFDLAIRGIFTLVYIKSKFSRHVGQRAGLAVLQSRPEAVKAR